MTFEEYAQKKFNETALFPFTVHCKQLKKGDIIIKKGNIIDTVYFVNSGILAAHMTDTNDDDKIIEFAFPSEFAAALSSSLSQTPSDFYTICLSDCVLQYFSFKELKKACEKSFFATKIYMDFIETSYMLRVKKEKDFLTKSTKERYLDLLTRRPTIYNEISIGDLAKYLGIHTNSLSRIRKQILINNKSI